MELFLTITGAIALVVTGMYLILRLHCYCEGREW